MGGTRIIGYRGRASEVTIPRLIDGTPVRSIKEEAFVECSRLTRVTIPDTMKTIGNGAFSYCFNLKSVTIPNSVTTMEERAFYKCTRLTSVTIPDSVTTIAPSMFCYCSSLTSVTIPDSVKTIGSEVFTECSRLKNVTIPNSVKTIGDHAFGYYYDVNYETYKWNYKKYSGFTIYGYNGTEAERYAKDNGFTFVSVNLSATPTKVKAKVKKNKVTLSWEAIKKNKKGKKLLKQIKFIQVQYSTDPNFQQDVKTKKVGKKKTKVTLKLKRKKTYYIKVRYKGNGGYSNWSKPKRVKTK